MGTIALGIYRLQLWKSFFFFPFWLTAWSLFFTIPSDTSFPPKMWKGSNQCVILSIFIWNVTVAEVSVRKMSRWTWGQMWISTDWGKVSCVMFPCHWNEVTWKAAMIHLISWVMNILVQSNFVAVVFKFFCNFLSYCQTSVKSQV